MKFWYDNGIISKLLRGEQFEALKIYQLVRLVYNVLILLCSYIQCTMYNIVQINWH